ncbi:ATP-binding protein [Natronococcus sp.]|uniref:ATP-binding response regulator n=1 Tax=Natronococcus sp. TaxID=35747 RepID=UPI003A4DAC50
MLAGQSSSRTLLLVEDDDLQARLYRTMLYRERGTASAPNDEDASGSTTTVETVGTLEEARTALEGDGEPFGLVLLDLNLPDSTGLETLDTVLETVDETAVVVLTGIDDAAVGREAVERGAEDYLVKDRVTPRLLEQTVTYAIERRRRVAEIERQRNELAVLHWLVRHEIRNDAAVVLGWVGALDATDPDSTRTVSRIEEAGEHIVELTESVGAMVESLEEPQVDLESVDLEAVIDEEIDRLESRYEGCTVTFDRPDEGVPVRADRFLNVVVRNVLTNAVVHGDEEGTVAVTVTREPDGGVEFAVSDDGPGLPAADRRRAAERGYTTDETGTGVGLYLVRTFVDRYGGSLAIESDPERSAGTTVRIRLESG